jgi:hypothetical protein
MATKKSLDSIFEGEDPLGLLNVKPAAPPRPSAEVKIIESFDEVNVFIDHFGRKPGEDPPEGRRKITPSERVLQAKLTGILAKPDIWEMLRPLDRHGLLTQADAVPASLDDLLDSDDPLLTDPNESLFTFRHARAPKGPNAKADEVAQRSVCKDFEQFKPLFERTVSELSSGRRKAIEFANESMIEAGYFFILRGVMCYVAEVNDPHVRNGKKNARLRVIFDNGTESNNLLRSLATELYKDPNGRRLTEPDVGPLFEEPTQTVQTVVRQTGQDRVTGCIYVVRSLSKDPEIKRLSEHLYKIGFTTGTMEDRIRGASDDPTFLLAAVAPVRSYQAININTNKFEALLHRFFDEARLDIEIQDRFGKPVRPREWFVIPIEIVERAIALILDGSIVRYRYDHQRCEVVEVQQQKSQYTQPLTQQEGRNLALLAHLQKLIADNPQESRRALEMSQEHLPEMFQIAQNQMQQHWAMAVMSSDTMLGLMPLSPSLYKSMMEQTSLRSLLEMLP